MHTDLDLKQGTKILFTGDSITDCGRLDRAYAPLGNGYVNFAANLLLASYPQLDLEIINTGINGNTTCDLIKRWEKDCLLHNPDVLSILIGVNDLWRHFGGFLQKRNAVDENQYYDNYRNLLTSAKQTCNCRIVLIEPFMFCDVPEDKMFKALIGYIDTVHKLADEFDAIVVALQSEINDKLRQLPPKKFSEDMVHPYQWVHAWIAQRWLQAVGA